MEDEKRDWLGKTHRLLIDEYKECGINWRYWGDVRWKQFTVFLTATGALAVVAIQGYLNRACVVRGWTVTPCHIALAIAGHTLVIACWVLEERAAYYRRAHVHRALEIEELFHLELISNDSIQDSRRVPSQCKLAHNPYWHSFQSTAVFRSIFALTASAWAGYAWWVRNWPIDYDTIVAIGLIVLEVVLAVFGWLVGNDLQYQAQFLEHRRTRLDTKRKPPLLEQLRRRLMKKSELKSNENDVPSL